MRALSVQEIDEVIGCLGIYKGTRLQTVLVADQDVVLGFWNRRVLWLWLDLSPTRPLLLPMVDLPLNLARRSSPLLLFLKAHFQGQTLSEVERVPDLGRVIRLRFEGGSEIEFRLIPRAVNLIARHATKSVSIHAVHELPPPQPQSPTPVRELKELTVEWTADRIGQKSAKKSPRADLEKRLTSARRSLEKVGLEIDSKSASPFRQLGNWIVEHQSLDVPTEYTALVDRRRKLAWNIEQCFHRAKEVERKLEGTRERQRELQIEVAEMERRLAEGNWLAVDLPKASAPKRLPPTRTLHLGNSCQVVVGKSAGDNLTLLRRAHSWDIWLHVKDQPSAHAILFRPRGFKVSDEELRKAAQWLLRMSLGSKHRQHVGEKFQILSSECRFVTPVKGDRLGRVTYRNEKVFTLRWEG